MRYSLKQIAEVVSGQLYGDENVIIEGASSDSRNITSSQIFVPFIGEKVDGHKFVKEVLDKGVVASFWQKDESLPRPIGNIIVVDDVLKAIQKLAAFHRRNKDIPFIGITGSSGKTSTKDMIASMLSAKYRVYKTAGNHNNKIGVPLTLLNMDDDAQIAVIEMGIDDIGIMDLLTEMVRPDYTVITSIAPAHIQQFKTMDKIVEQKCLINRLLPKNGKCFYNKECYGVENKLIEMGLKDQMASFGFSNVCSLQATSYSLINKSSCFKVKQYPDKEFRIPVLGKYQVADALSAILIGRELNFSYEDIQSGFDKIKITPRRMQFKNIKDCTIIDDSYNSNPSSLTSSLSTFVEYDDKENKVVVIGDMLELGEDSSKLHASISEKVDFSKFNKIYLIGKEMKHLSEALNEKHIENKWFIDWQTSLTEVKKEIKKENIVFFKASNGMDFSGLITALED